MKCDYLDYLVYFVIVTLLLFVLPITSVVIELLAPGPLTATLVCKWYAFWAVGVRLASAGLSQMIRPQFTQKILGISGEETRILVRELGFANLAVGVLGTASLGMPDWRLPAALSGGIFYLLAGVNHCIGRHRNRQENVAMLSDLLVGAILVVCVAVELYSKQTHAGSG